MASEAVQIADALVTSLNAESWPVSFTAERAYAFGKSRVQMGSTIYCHVRPMLLNQERAHRRGNTRRYGIEVVLRHAVDPDVVAETDELIETVEDIIDHYQSDDNRRLSGYDTAVAESAEVLEPGGELYDPDEMRTNRVFVGGVVITFKVME